MMNPLRSMMMADPQSSGLNIITVEEGMDCREANSRFFSLLNHESRLDVIISKTSTIVSCKLDGHEIVVDQRLYNQTHETWAIGDRPYQKISSLPWNCHVRGAELLLSVSNGTSSMLYELTRFNELNSIVKLKSIHLQHQASYFNLNNAKEKVPIDGHTLVVQCNGNMNRIQVQNTKLLCQCNKKSSILPQSLIGDIPFELVQHDSSISQNGGGQTNDNLETEDDLIVCDAIFSLLATCPLDFLRVQLKYNDRALLFETRSTSPSSSTSSHNSNSSSSTTTTTTSSSNNSSNQHQNANVSSSTTSRNTKPTTNDLQNYQTQQASSSSMVFVKSESIESPADFSDFKSQDKWLSSLVDSPSTSCQPISSQSTPTNTGSAQNSSGPSSSSHPSTILRIRIRVTNFGICIMPLMMTNYSCTYRFT